MKLCIAEKPSVGKEIARILGATTSKSGYMEGNGYQVSWTFGHLCELKEPHEYNSTWKKWGLWYLPMLPSKFGIRLKADKGIAVQFNTIKTLMDNAEMVINCGDAGQEGELIQRWVYQLAGCHVPVMRLWISSLTDEAIKDGFLHLKPQKDFDRLYQAGAMRAIGDWLLGMNATRAYSCRYASYGNVLSVGRVQTPTLALVVNRFMEIKNFQPKQYWELKTIYREVTFSSTHGRFNTKEEGEALLQQINNVDFFITNISDKKGSELPPRLFDLTSLQVECNKRFSLSADNTLSIIQSLYEKKLATYPRVDTTYLPDDLYPKIPSILKGLSVYASLSASVLSKKIVKSKRVFDNSKITDHHAIIPTGVNPVQGSLSAEESKVFDFICRRFIANFYPDCIFSTTTVLGAADKVEFKATGKRILEEGWKVVFSNGFSAAPDDEDKKEEGSDNLLPAFVVGEYGPHTPSFAEKWTSPPKLFTEATLLRAMETAGKLVDNDELRDLMKENGIGRPSTRAAILETLYKREYMLKKRKNIEPTPKGIDLINSINVDLLKNVELTGQWEKKLRMIEHEQYNVPLFLSELKQMVSEVVAKVKADTNYSKKSDVASLKCPLCHFGYLIKGHRAFGCSNWKSGCSFRLPFVVKNHSLSDVEVKTLISGQTIVVEDCSLHLDDKGIIAQV